MLDDICAKGILLESRQKIPKLEEIRAKSEDTTALFHEFGNNGIRNLLMFIKNIQKKINIKSDKAVKIASISKWLKDK